MFVLAQITWMGRVTGAPGPCAASPVAAETRSARGPAATPARPPSPAPATGPTAQVGAQFLGNAARGSRERWAGRVAFKCFWKFVKNPSL